MEKIEKIVDIEKEMRSSEKSFFRKMPRFFIRIIEKVICQDEMNSYIHKIRHLEGIPFVNASLKSLNIELDVHGAENLPSGDRFIFAANHPYGSIDTLACFSMAAKYYNDIKSVSNELMKRIPNFSPLMVGVNVFGQNSKEAAARLNSLFESGSHIIYFPSGEVSRRINGVISDSAWQKTFITKAVQYKRDIIPVFISGRNSELFYRIASIRKFLGIKIFIESMLLPREMMRKRNTTVTLTVGKVIPYQTFTKEFSHQEWAQKVKSKVYELSAS